MLNKKSQIMIIKDLGCVLGLLLKHYHKTSKLVQIVYYLLCALSEIIEQWNKYQGTQTLSNIGVVHSDKDIHII